MILQHFNHEKNTDVIYYSYNNEKNRDIIYYYYNNEKDLSTNLSEFHQSSF